MSSALRPQLKPIAQLFALSALMGCAEVALETPRVMTACLNEQQGCEPDCFENQDCGEGSRCVEGLCYENECESGDSRSCESGCGMGTQQCVGGIWRACTGPMSTESCEPSTGGAPRAGSPAGAQAGAEVTSGGEGGGGGSDAGAALAGAVAGATTLGGAGAQAGGEVPSCQEGWTELCSDGLDQDCDGRVDEGCGTCYLVGDEPVVNPSNGAHARFNDETGAVKLSRIGLVRRGLLTKNSVSYQPVLYGLGTTTLRYAASEPRIEAGSAKAFFPIGAKVGALLKTASGLKLIMASVSGETERAALVTSEDSSEESVLVAPDRLVVSWTEGGDVMLRSYTLDTLSPQGLKQRLSEAPFRSGASVVAQTAVGLVALFEDERNQGEQPELWVAGVREGGGVMTQALTQGSSPKLLWQGGALYVIFVQREGERQRVMFARLDPELLTFLAPPQPVFEADGALQIRGLSPTEGEGLMLLFTEDKLVEGRHSAQFNALYVSPEGRPLKGPFLPQQLTSRASQGSSDLFFDPERRELIIGWMESGYVDNFSFQMMKVKRVSLEALPSCATAER